MNIFTHIQGTRSYTEEFNVSPLMTELYVPAYEIKGKAFPLQAWTGPKGFRRLRVSDFKTFGT